MTDRDDKPVTAAGLFGIGAFLLAGAVWALYGFGYGLLTAGIAVVIAALIKGTHS